MPQSAISKTKYTVILTASVPVISKTKYTVVFHQRLLRKLQYYGAGNKIYVTKANERTENSFELPRVRHFDLSVDLFASALIGPQSAPRAFHSRFSRRNRTCSKILWRALGPRTKNRRTCHTLRFQSHDQIVSWKAACGYQRCDVQVRCCFTSTETHTDY